MTTPGELPGGTTVEVKDVANDVRLIAELVNRDAKDDAEGVPEGCDDVNEVDVAVAEEEEPCEIRDTTDDTEELGAPGAYGFVST